MRTKLVFTLAAILAVISLVVPSAFTNTVFAAQSPQIPLAGKSIPQFVDPLPILDLAGGTIKTIVAGTSEIELHMREFQARMLPSTFVPATGSYTGTWVWGYINGPTAPTTSLDTYTGPVVVATRGTPTKIRFVNDLGSAATTNVLAYKYSTDQTLHWADPLGQMDMSGMIPTPGSVGASNYTGPVPAVPHLHGGEVPPVLDGGPDAWFTSDGSVHGATYYTDPNSTAAGNAAVYNYPNTQEAGPLWFHDHTLGATRLNVYAGLAGAYLLTDPSLTLPTGLTAAGLQQGATGSADLIVPLVIQDRMFDTNGQLFFPADTAGGLQYALNPEHPYWVPEFLGNTICVNGKTWPFLNVEARRYRFELLNGSNARTYELSLAAPMWVIGTDGGYLDAPVAVSKLLMQPGERYDIIVDFSKSAGKTMIMSNTAKTPYPKGTVPDPQTVGKILQFRVAPAMPAGYVDNSFNPALGTAIRPAGKTIVRLPGTVGGPAIVTAPGLTQNVQKTRELTLNEVMGMAVTAINPVTGLSTKYPGGPLEILVNNTKWSGKHVIGFDTTTQMPITEPIPGYAPDDFGNYLSELPNEGETEIWEIVNLTADTHPIHLHLVQFQLLNRQAFNTSKYITAYNAAFPGGGYDYMTGLPYPAGVFMPGFGSPKSYDPTTNPLSGGKYGGNLDVTPYLQGKVNLPLPNENGWKDTVMMNPGEVTRIVVRWAPTDLPANTPPASASYPFNPQAGGREYVWHCHIVDHEDNEMMRPDQVIPNIDESLRTLQIGINY